MFQLFRPGFDLERKESFRDGRPFCGRRNAETKSSILSSKNESSGSGTHSYEKYFFFKQDPPLKGRAYNPITFYDIINPLPIIFGKKPPLPSPWFSDPFIISFTSREKYLTNDFSHYCYLKVSDV